MAMTDLIPPTVPEDYFTLEKIQALLREAGRRVSKTTLRRWQVRYGIDARRVGRADYLDFSGVLEAEREERERAAPEGGR